jgi:cell fate regulator YaaT (PSP1 superfamily)
MDKIFVLRMANGPTFEARCDETLAVSAGDTVIFERDFYNDAAEIKSTLEQPSMTANASELPRIIRKADENDLENIQANISKARGAMGTTKQHIEALGLPMKLVNAHYSIDGKLVTIQFCADGRVDFRELVKELSRALSVRIELRQIGVRDETGIFGGIAVCGQPLCCSRFLKEFNSINVKMAKEQDLSLTPSSISGVCGRLKCCLKFEHEVYLELEKDMPRKGEFCDTPAGRGKICDRNILSRKVSVAFESGNVSIFSVDEITPAGHERKENKAPRPAGKNNKNNNQNNHSGNANGNGGKGGKNNKKHSGNGNQNK